MKTLYDLLGALPDDDAEDLRAAFRRAVKANHPDLNPGDPEASQAFRRIVRANAILSDERQREAYDRLLEVARRQQIPKPKRSSFSDRSRRLGADAMVSALASAAFIGGYVLLKPVDRLPLASAQVTGISRHEMAYAAGDRFTELSSQERTSQAEKPEDPGADMKFVDHPQEEPANPDSIAPAVTTGRALAHMFPDSRPEIKDVKYYRERGISAYRRGDLYIALANFDWRSSRIPLARTAMLIAGLSCIAWAI